MNCLSSIKSIGSCLEKTMMKTMKNLHSDPKTKLNFTQCFYKTYIEKLAIIYKTS